ncbi:MAG: NAD(P)H-dependent oxidoreductase subunit E [Deltaproteobacteria bacterium]|nr:NAD(P)H-dependent oxidoreductase subunit E [Deltaproteobacteria bacterium]
MNGSVVESVESIVERHGFHEHALIAVLQDIQRTRNWLPPEALDAVMRLLDVPRSRVYAIATFYKAFSLKPRGKHVLQCCVGTACHVRGAQQIIDRLGRELGIGPGETTPDMMFTLERVRCVGCCSIAPVVRVGDAMYGRLTQIKAGNLPKKFREPAARD